MNCWPRRLNTPKSSFASKYANAKQPVDASSASATPTSYAWFNRGPSYEEDPWVGIGDHVGTLLYGENGVDGGPAFNGPKNSHGGVGVFVR
jgi:hypothetical protein